MRTRTAALAIAIALPPVVADAGQQIDFASTPVSNNFTSAGASAPLDDDFVFELGAFDTGGGWAPGSGNTAEWAARWQAVGRLSYNATNSWFTGSAELGSNTAPFVKDAAAYIWGFDTSGEWILLKNPVWVWPDAAGGAGLPPMFSVAEPGTTAVLGLVSPDGSAGYQMMTAPAGGAVPDVVPGLWLAQHFSVPERADPTISGWDMDPDGDGENNLAELAAGTDPRSGASVRPVAFGFVDFSGTVYRQVELQRSGRAAIEHILATSVDLASWDLSGASVSVIEDSETRLLLRATQSVGAAGREFYQFLLVKP